MNPNDHEPFQNRLEHELVTSHRLRYGDRVRSRSSWRMRVAAGVAALLVAAIAMAAVPVRMPTGLGSIVTIELPAGHTVPQERDLLAHVLGAPFGAAQVSASVDVSDSRARVLLLLFGEQVDVGRMRGDLQRAFPSLSAGEWKATRIEADLRTSVAGLLGHRLLALEVEREQRASMRSRIVQGLAAHGWTGDVSIADESGIRLIRIEPNGTTTGAGQ